MSRHSYHVVILFYPLGPSVQINSMNAFSLGLYFISIFSCLLSYHCNIINGAHNISEQDLIKSPAQDVITAYALADSYERNRSEDSFNLKEASDLDEGPSLSNVKLASKWMHSVIDATEPSNDRDIDERTDTTEEDLKNPGEDYTSNSTVENIGKDKDVEIDSQKVREPVLEDPYFGTSTSTLADNATVLELLKEQIARDFAPFILIINAITPTPVKAFLASQFTVLSAKLKLVLRGAFSPLLSAAVKLFLVTGNGLIFVSQELVKWQEAYEEREEHLVQDLAPIIPSDESIALPPLNLEADVLVDNSGVLEEAETVSDISPAELEIEDEPDERSEEEGEEEDAYLEGPVDL